MRQNRPITIATAARTGNRRRSTATRERVRERAKARERRLRTTLLAAFVVGAILIAGAVGIAVWQADRPGEVTVPPVATEDGAGLAVGSGPVAVEIYLDFLCPACRQFEAASRSMLDAAIDAGEITLTYRPIAILDRASTTRYSTRSAAAAGCAADTGGITEFTAAMLDRQPAEGTAGHTDGAIIEIGRDAGITDPTFASCITSGPYLDWATANTERAGERGVTSTPTVFVDGTRLPALDPVLLRDAIAAAGAGG